MNMGAFPSGQWGQTVNLLLNASVVRIHQLPPKDCDEKDVTVFFLCCIVENQRFRQPILNTVLQCCPTIFGRFSHPDAHYFCRFLEFGRGGDDFLRKNRIISAAFRRFSIFPQQFPIGCGDFLLFPTVFSFFSNFPFSTYT